MKIREVHALPTYQKKRKKRQNPPKKTQNTTNKKPQQLQKPTMTITKPTNKPPPKKLGNKIPILPYTAENNCNYLSVFLSCKQNKHRTMPCNQQ